VLTPFYEAIAWLVVHIHDGLAHLLPATSGAAWALSIVLLTMAMRLLLVPLFVKQIRNQRAMTVLQPKMKELQAKYKNDKERLNQEMMALWREHGANPFAGCLPLLLQMPVFFALFRVLNSLKPGSGCASVHDPSCFSSHYGIGSTVVAQAAQAKLFGVPISAAFTSSSSTLHLLGASSSATKVLTMVLIVTMAATTFLTQRQLMARTAATGGSQMAQQQKILLYMMPLMLAVFGYRFPVGVLLYWLTTNLWSMGQQRIVIRRMEASDAQAAAAKAAAAPTGPAPGAKPTRTVPGAPAAALAPSGGASTNPPAEPQPKAPARPGGNAPRPSANRRPSNRKRSKKRGRR
jgi:YidC/Oxa1 family membrane protein insertase